jgi:hypothetical protein
MKGGRSMSAPVLGIDIAKQRIEVALLVDDLPPKTVPGDELEYGLRMSKGR